MFSAFFNVLVFVYKLATISKRWHMPLIVHLDFLQSPHQSFILLSCAEAFALTLVDLFSIPPSLEPKTYYHFDVEIFIDDETKEASV
jgi:hypothetical protein